jgi:transposase-like protein
MTPDAPVCPYCDARSCYVEVLAPRRFYCNSCGRVSAVDIDGRLVPPLAIQVRRVDVSGHLMDGDY